MKVSTKEITTPKASAPIETLASFREEQLSKPHSSTVTVLPTIVRSPSTPSSGPTKKRRIDGKAMDDNGMERNPTKSLLSRQHSKKFKKEFSVRSSEYTFESIGGVDKILKELCELLLHIKHPTVYKKIGLPPPRGFLLHGPPGCGKTLLAQAIAGVSTLFTFIVQFPISLCFKWFRISFTYDELKRFVIELKRV